MQGNKQFSTKIILRCLNNLKADPSLINDILNENEVLFGEYKDVSEKVFSIIPKWKYWAYLELIKYDKTSTTSEIAQKLDITIDELEEVKKVLAANGLINLENKTSSNNKMINIDSNFDLTSDLQKEISHLSINALDDVEKDYRYHGSMIFAVDKSSIKELKKRLADLQIEFCSKATKNGRPNEVYAFSSSLFPLTND